jgi:hypothetical protein
MKTRATNGVHGHVIILTLIVCLLLGLVLVSVISLGTNEGQMTGRSQNWNAAIPIAEAGIEEALTHLKYSPTNRASNGWTLAATGDHHFKSRTNGITRYDVTISTNYDPTIISRGAIRAPNQTNYIVRTVRVMATNEPMFSAAIEATDGIFFKGSGVTINSYDSRDPKYYNPTTGRYDPTKFNDQGRVICHYGPFELANGKVWGRIETTEESSLTMGPGGVVGDIMWHLNNTSGIQPGWHTSTTSSEFSSLEAPPGGGSLPARVGGVYTLSNNTYRTTSIRGDIVVKGQATLIVQNDFEVNGIIIERDASIKLYVNAGSVALKGIDNKNLRAESFQYYGTSGNRAVSMQGNAAFCGILFAPDAELSIGGGGNDEIDFLGAIIARIVKVNGKMTFHFDEAVRRLGSRGFTASRWDEL